MRSDIRPTLILTIILGVAVLLFVIVMTMSFLRNDNPTTPQPIAGTPTPIKSSGSPTDKQGVVSGLEVTSIGQTTDTQVKSKLKVVSEKKEGDITIYEVESSIPGSTNEIRTQAGVVIFESTNIQISPPAPPKISEVESKYGEAEKIISKVGEGFYTDAYLYPSQGFMVFVNRYTKTVYTIQRFTPMTVAQYESQYGEFLTLKEGAHEVFN